MHSRFIVTYSYYDPFYRTYKYTMTQIIFLPPPGFEPGSLGTVTYPLCYCTPPEDIFFAMAIIACLITLNNFRMLDAFFS